MKCEGEAETKGVGDQVETHAKLTYEMTRDEMLKAMGIQELNIGSGGGRVLVLSGEGLKSFSTNCVRTMKKSAP